MQHNHLSSIEAGLKYPRTNLIARLAVGLVVSIEDLINGKVRFSNKFTYSSYKGHVTATNLF